jgi:hypothetical protein
LFTRGAGQKQVFLDQTSSCDGEEEEVSFQQDDQQIKIDQLLSEMASL